MLKRFFLSLLPVVCLSAAAPATTTQPVFIVLYSRFYDHGNSYANNERIQLLIPLLQKLRAGNPDSGISGLFEFSGTMSQVFLESNPALHLVDQVKEAARQGIVEVGYTGEDEPSYLYRPKPELLTADTPEKRWKAQAEAAERFLTDFKNPITGRPVPGLTGGLLRTQEIFGPASFIRGVTDIIGGDAPVTHEVRKINGTAMMLGIPSSDTGRGIEAYGYSANAFSTDVSPESNTSPEVFWQDGALRLSDLSMTDNKPLSTDDSLIVLKRAFERLDRSKVRVIAMEIGSYRRYLTKRPDGSVLYDPMEWMYYHPDHPQFPPTMKPFVQNPAVMAAYRNEAEVLNWLLKEFIPANPGSRFLQIRDLEKMAGPTLPPQVGLDEIKAMARDYDSHFKASPTKNVDYLRAGDKFFSTAEAFELMAEELAAEDKTGSLLESVKPTPVYGPIFLPNDMGPFKGSVTVREVLQAASRVAPGLRNTEWKTIPDNAIPAYVETGALHLNSAQFLRMMAWAIQDPSPDRVLSVSAIEPRTDLSFRYPRNAPLSDQGTGWTMKPARLGFVQQAPTGAAAAVR